MSTFQYFLTGCRTLKRFRTRNHLKLFTYRTQSLYFLHTGIIVTTLKTSKIIIFIMIKSALEVIFCINLGLAATNNENDMTNDNVF